MNCHSGFVWREKDVGEKGEYVLVELNASNATMVVR
jgi:hypothetical protein